MLRTVIAVTFMLTLPAALTASTHHHLHAHHHHHAHHHRHHKLCLFGDSLATAARYKDLQAGPVATYTIKQRLAREVESKLRLIAGGEGSADLADLVDEDGTFSLRTLTNIHTGDQYEVLLTHLQSNPSGGILHNNRVVAGVSNNNIDYCSVFFDVTHNTYFKSYPAKACSSPGNSSYFGHSLVELERLAQFSIAPLKNASTMPILESKASAQRLSDSASYVITDLHTGSEFLLAQSEQGGGIVTKSIKPKKVADIKAGSILEQAPGFIAYGTMWPQ